MKNITSFSIAATACLFALILFTGVECNDNGTPGNPEKCGEKIVDKKWFENISATELNENCAYDVNAHMAKFSFNAPMQENVCPHEHVKITIEIICHLTIFQGWEFEAEIMHGVLYRSYITKDVWEHRNDNNYRYYKATTDVGLSASFDDNPGWYQIFLDLKLFSDDGCEIIAKSIAEKELYMIKIDWEHYKYKAP